MTADQRKPTDFEISVYDFVRNIPQGKVVSYGEVARGIGRGTARSVGTALGKNPFAPEVPCHRVVRADGSLGGFYRETTGHQMERKQQMLRAESVKFSPDGRVLKECFCA